MYKTNKEEGKGLMKSKTSNKRAKLVAILLVLVMLISVGYAALETLLQISGTATLKKKTWNVHFANVQILQRAAPVSSSSLYVPALVLALMTDRWGLSH